MSIFKNLCPNTQYLCNKANNFWFYPRTNGSKREITIFHSILDEEDDCVECYYCILPIGFSVDLSCFLCSWCYFTNCCYLKNNTVNPMFYEHGTINKDVAFNKISSKKAITPPTSNTSYEYSSSDEIDEGNTYDSS